MDCNLTPIVGHDLLVKIEQSLFGKCLLEGTNDLYNAWTAARTSTQAGLSLLMRGKDAFKLEVRALAYNDTVL